MTIRDAVIACLRMGMDWRTVALAYKLSDAQVDAIIREAITPKRRSKPARAK